MEQSLRIWKKYGPFLLLALLVVSLVPILLLGRYDWPSADDYSYALYTHEALSRGVSPLVGSWAYILRCYQGWQGTFSAVGLMTLTPLALSPFLYWLTPLVMLAALCAGTFKLARTGREILWAVAPGTLAALMVGGSNYVSALLSVLLCGLFLLWFLWKDRRKFLPALLPTALLCVGFFISMAAPGNEVRQGTVTPPIGAADAVFRSIAQAWTDVQAWFSWPVLLVFLLMIPLLWSLTEKTAFRFPLPPLFTLLSFLLFAAQNAPHFYALGEAGPERLRSIVFYSFFWLTAANFWYWLGWARRAVLPRFAGRVKRTELTWLAAPVLVVLLAAVMVQGRYGGETTFARTAAALTDGSAEYYWQQQMERLPLLEDPSVEDVLLEPLDVPDNLRELLYNGDVHPDPKIWLNQAITRFYHKDTVALDR